MLQTWALKEKTLRRERCSRIRLLDFDIRVSAARGVDSDKGICYESNSGGRITMFCPVCGAQVPAGMRFCGACGAQIPVAGTPTAAAAEPTADSSLARMGDRFLALVLDTVLFGAVFAAAGMAIARRFGGITEQGFSFEGTPALVSIGATLLIAFLYYWLCEGLCGATLGKGMIGICVRMKDGRACQLRPSLIRNLLRLIDGFAVYLVGFLIAVLSKQRQRLGDHVAGTIVVERRAGTAARAAFVILWLVLLGGGLAGAYMLHRGAPDRARLATGGRTAPEPPPAKVTTADLPAMNFTTTGALKVVNFDYVQSEGGPSRPAAPYAPGDKAYLKYDVVGYSSDSEGRPKLRYDVAAFDPNGLLLHAPWKDEYTGRLESGRPVHGTFSVGIPRSVPAGTCKVVIKVRDEINSAELQLTAPFRVDAVAVGPATSLEIRDFSLSTSENGPAVAALELQGGGTFYMRCNVFGPQFRGDEADVRMTVKVTGPGGKVVFEKADYGSISDTWAYHPPTFHVPVSGHLSLPGGSEKGAYTVVYTFTDTIAGKSVIREGRFEVK